MSKLTRVTQLPFGSTGPTGDFGVFGSKAEGSPDFSKDPSTIQSLPNYLDGWGEAIIGDYDPPLEDMNSLFLLTFYQIGYVLQMGIAEYDASTNYFTNSICQYGGVIYISAIDNNLGNTPSLTSSQWQMYQPPQLVIENRTSDPLSPVPGRIWLRTDI